MNCYCRVFVTIPIGPLSVLAILARPVRFPLLIASHATGKAKPAAEKPLFAYLGSRGPGLSGDQFRFGIPDGFKKQPLAS